MKPVTLWTRTLYRLTLSAVLFIIPALASGQEPADTTVMDTTVTDTTVTDTTVTDTTLVVEGTPIRVGARTAFVLKAGIEEMTLQERSEAVNRRIAQARSRGETTPGRQISATDSTRWEIRLGETLIVLVGPNDAQAEGLSADSLSAVWLAGLRAATDADQRTRNIRSIALKVAVGLLFPVLLWVAFVLLGRFWIWIGQRLMELQHRWAGGLYIGGFELLQPGTIASVLPPLLRFVKGAVYIAVLYGAIVFFFSFFPQTRPLGARMLDAALAPVLRFGRITLEFVPLIVAAVVVTLVVRFALRVIDFILDRMNTGFVSMPARGHRLLYSLKHVIRPVIIAAAVLFILSYVPGRGSVLDDYAMYGLLGLLILGFWRPFESVVADIILSYIRPFQPGDRIRLNTVTGVVISESAFFIQLRDDGGNVHVIPKRLLLDGDFTNEGRRIDKVPVKIRIRTDLTRPVEDVEKLCMEAVEHTDGLEEGALVRIIRLDLKEDCAIYEIAGQVLGSRQAETIESELYRRILADLQQEDRKQV